MGDTLTKVQNKLHLKHFNNIWIILYITYLLYLDWEWILILLEDGCFADIKNYPEWTTLSS